MTNPEIITWIALHCPRISTSENAPFRCKVTYVDFGHGRTVTATGSDHEDALRKAITRAASRPA